VELVAGFDGPMNILHFNSVLPPALRNSHFVNCGTGPVSRERRWSQAESWEVCEGHGGGRRRGWGWTSLLLREAMELEKQCQLCIRDRSLKIFKIFFQHTSNPASMLKDSLNWGTFLEAL